MCCFVKLTCWRPSWDLSALAQSLQSVMRCFFFSTCSWYIIPHSLQLTNKRGDKKAPCSTKWQRQIKEKCGEEGGAKRGGEKRVCRPANGGGPEGNTVNVMSAMNALSGCMYVRVRGTHQWGPNLSPGTCVHYLVPLCTSLTAIF